MLDGLWFHKKSNYIKLFDIMFRCLYFYTIHDVWYVCVQKIDHAGLWRVYVMWLRAFLLSMCNYAYQWLSNPTHPQDICQLQKPLIYPSHEWLRFQAAPLLGRVPRPAPQLGAESGTSRLSRPKTWVQMYGAFDVRTFGDTKFESHGHGRVFKVFSCEIS